MIDEAKALDEALRRHDEELARQSRLLERLCEQMGRVLRIVEGEGQSPLPTRLALVEDRVAEHRKIFAAALGAVGVQLVAVAGAVVVWLLTRSGAP